MIAYTTDAPATHDTTEPLLETTKRKKQKKRAKPTLTPEMNAKLDNHMQHVRNSRLQKTKDGQAQHFIDFYEANGWPSLIEDPTYPLEQY